MDKKLYRNTSSKMIGGVCSGLSDYFNLDVSLIRVGFVALFVIGGTGFLAYLIMWAILPTNNLPPFQQFTGTNNFNYQQQQSEQNTGQSNEQNNGASYQQPPFVNPSNRNTSFVIGIILIALGSIFLLNNLLDFNVLQKYWPVIMIIIGGSLLIPKKD
jgi:phage shock protein PspC (stress-responsive transcriptional regulator)